MKKWVVSSLGQEMYNMSLEHLVILENKATTKDNSKGSKSQPELVPVGKDDTI